MKKIALAVGAATLALSVMTAPVALAQETGPGSNACSKARIAEAEALKDLRAAERDRNRFRDAAKDGQVLTITLGGLTLTADAIGGINDAERAALDSLNGQVDRLERKLAEAVEKRKDKCDDPAPTTPPTTTTVPPTTVVDDPDVDCTEVSDARAQEILNADRNDPNNLDEDNDGVACEEEVVVKRDVVVAPSGGVATGGGPA
jgi:hypothetical protein